MAAGGYREFIAGEVLDEGDINNYLMQGMLVFAGTAARGSAIGTAVEGQFSFLTDTDTIEYYDGSAWVEFATGVPNMVATGGNGTATSGGYTYHVFTGTADLTVTQAGLCDVLLIGAGGGGSRGRGSPESGGGGGAGAVVLIGNAYFDTGTVTATIGAGGIGGTGSANETVSGAPGELTSFSTFIAAGGGAGVGEFGAGGLTVGSRGGSNGGGASNTSSSEYLVGSPIGGYTGGYGELSHGAGGGGGAGSAGANAINNDTGGAGGAGTSTYSTWLTAINSLMPAGWQTATSNGAGTIAGGGGGGGDATGGAGGSGGGGNGATGSNAGAQGEDFTGSGGGGTENGTPGAGGDGLVIVRYAV